MKTTIKLFFLACSLFIGINAGAQSATSSSFGQNGGEGGLSFGVHTGINFAGFSGKGAKEELLDGRIAYHVGVSVEYTLPSNLYFLSGLDFTAKGAKYDETDDTERYKENYTPLYIQLPIHAGYKIGITDDVNIGLHAGPYLAFGIGGKYKEEYTDSDYPSDNWEDERDFFGSEDEGGFKSFDFGIGFGADLNFNKCKIGLGYDLGLSNIGRNKDYPFKNRNFYISVGYNF